MYEFIILLRNYMMGIYNALNTAKFEIMTYEVGFGNIMVVVMVVGLVISVFWRGAKT